MSADRPIEAVLVDLDDTLYPQHVWLRRAWSAVARAARPYGVDADALVGALDEVAREGSDRGRVIDRSLERIGRRDVPVDALVHAFRTFDGGVLEPYPGAREALTALRRCVRTGIVTDGDPLVQRSKLRSLDISRSVDEIVISDDFGRRRRKPDPHALLVAASRLGVASERCVYIGDRPAKDVAAAAAAGMRSVRVRTGEYAEAPDEPTAWLRADDFPSAVRALAPWLPDEG